MSGAEPDPDIDQDELVKELERKRTHRGAAAIAVSMVAILFSAFQMWLAARSFIFSLSLPFVGRINLGSIQLLQANAIHVGFGLVLAFLLFPPSTGDGKYVQRLSSLFEDFPRLRAAGRWFAVDTERTRITPLDALCIVFAVLAPLFMLFEFDVVRRMRALGLGSSPSLAELYTIFEPLSGVPILGTTPLAFILGVVGVLLVLEATRRALGFYLMMIVAAFIVYAKFGYLIPLGAPYIGILSTSEASWASIIQNLWYNTENGVFGVPVAVSVQFIYIFILFGAFLEMSGAGQWFIDLAYSLTGDKKGGPAKASIMASGFMGMISGSSIANTVTTGAFTIPLMKKSGYRAEFAGAVEASASSGGQILPPVMGAAAFLIVEYTLTPFRDVIMAAAIPAIVFFFGVWVMVHLEASRRDIGGLAKEDLVEMIPHLRHGWFYLVPLGLLLYYLLVERLSVARSAWFTIVAIGALIAFVAAYGDETRVTLPAAITTLFLAEVATYATAGTGILAALGGGGAGLPLDAAVGAALGKLGWITIAVSAAVMLWKPDLDAPLLNYNENVPQAAESSAGLFGRPGLASHNAYRFGTFVLKSMDSGARTATTVVIAVAAAGIIPGVISVSGLGPNLTSLILAVSGGSIVILLVLTAISSILLGMGMPTTVTYIILVSMLGPAIAEFGIPILAAHLFILYFGVIADITPPVAVAAYAASGIAKSDEFQTGVTAFSLSLNKAIVPFAFVLSPGILLLRGTGTGEEVHVITLAEVADLGFFVPEVLIPVIGVFLGVVGLGATVIGYLYTTVSTTERVGFAVSALLLMAPGLIYGFTSFLLRFAGVSVGELAFDLTFRAIGAAMFVALVLKNKREAGSGGTQSPTKSATADV